MDNNSFHQLPLAFSDKTITIDDGGALISRTILPGGIRVISQQVPATHSVSLGLWIPAGSRDEGETHLGSTHYLEHLLFKGSASRSAYQIAHAFDAVGGDFNAATAKESTHYYCRVLSRDLPMAVSVLTEMLVAPTLSEDDFNLERNVILDELAMSADDPSDVAFEQFALAMFGDSPLGRPVGGTAETVSATPLSAVKAHHQQWYRPEYLVVAAAGDVNHQELCELVFTATQTSGWKLEEGVVPQAATRRKPIDYRPVNQVITKDVEQSQVLIGFPTFGAQDNRRDAMSVLLTVLSGGMSSRLFQEIREKRGLAYSTYAFNSVYSDCGQFGLYAGCNRANIEEVSELMLLQLQRIADGEVTQAELDMARGQLSGGVTLGLESNSARMNWLGRSEVVHHQLRTVTQLFEEIAQVTAVQVQALAQELINSPEIRVTVRGR